MENIKEFKHDYFLTAAECNPEKEMPLSLVMTKIIEVATMHANAWGVGYANMIASNQGWVLSRVTIEMKRYPKVNEAYKFITWIEDYNRHFSQRNMEIQDLNGEVIGYVRTIWMVINFATRESVDISQLSYIRENISDHPCPIEPQSRLRPVSNGKTVDYTFRYMDCDINRHVNTVKYLDLLLNQFSLEKFDREIVKRLEIAFLKETLYGTEAQIHLDDSDPMDCKLSIDVDGASHVRSRIIFSPRE
ncbi:MAG: thioesterase [Bacteroidales bacterium]|nr:thioesterase [Bacteroidales bacterium]